VLQQLELDHVLAFRHSDTVAEVTDGLRGITAPPHPRDGRHARVVPASHVPFLDEPEEPALAHDRVGDVEPGELALAGMNPGQIEGLEDPFVERPVHFELEGADTVGDALHVVAQAVGEVVHRVDAPPVTRMMVRGMADTVKHRVAQPDVGGAHVDLGAQGPGSVGEFALPHAPEQVEVLGHRAIPVKTLPARAIGRTPHPVDLLRGVVADVGLALADQLESELVERLKVVGSVEGLQRLALALEGHDRREKVIVAAVDVDLLGQAPDRLQTQTVVGPARDEPLDVRGDGIDVFDILLGGVGVVHTEIAPAAELPGDAEVEADGLGMADV